MTLVTDEVAELAELSFFLLETNGHSSGAVILAQEFETQAWSTDFYFLIGHILRRAENLKKHIAQLGLDDGRQDRAIGHVEAWQEGFKPDRLSDAWNNSTSTRAALSRCSQFEMLSDSVRRIAPLPKVSDDDRARLLTISTELLRELDALQGQESEFLRQVMIEGLEQLQYRLLRLRWLGWGYTREAIDRLLMLYRELTITAPEVAQSGDMVAVFHALKDTAIDIMDRPKTVKDRYEATTFPLTIASHAYAVYSIGKPVLQLGGS